MASRVFFSFHYERDNWRAGQVRNSWVTKPDRETAGYWDSASWEEVKKKGDDAIKRWIDNQLDGTSVTVVLVGKETAKRKFVKYEIEQSIKKGNGLIVIYIHNLKDKDGRTDSKGKNPLDTMYKIDENGRRIPLSQIYKSYDWASDDGYNNFPDWVESAKGEAKSGQVVSVNRNGHTNKKSYKNKRGGVSCKRCGRTLTAPESISRGYGSYCYRLL